jgi:uncharacterized protein (DUF488 family)
MEPNTLYSIGHGNRSAEELISLLKSFGVQYLIDVRSSPYSKFNPQFNQNTLKFSVENEGVKYVFMGDVLGGRPKDVTCYKEGGVVDYEIIKTKDFFKSGIERIKVAYEKNIKVALMCSESKPQECHRSKLIGEVLRDANITVQHIDEKGKLKTQNTVILKVTKGQNPINLFGETITIVSSSRKKYIDEKL